MKYNAVCLVAHPLSVRSSPHPGEANDSQGEGEHEEMVSRGMFLAGICGGDGVRATILTKKTRATRRLAQ